MSLHVVKFDPAGDGHCLYTERIDLKAIGSLQIARASTIEFNNTKETWEVRNTAGHLLFSNASRALCVAWEEQYFNR